MANTEIEIELDDKSQNSYDAGVKLMSWCFYTSSVHCFYYSVLQLMKYKLANLSRGALSYQQQEEKVKLYSASTHEWLFLEIRNRFGRGINKDNFVNDFQFLKKARLQADYGKRSFNQDQSADCRSVADRLIANLNNIR